MTSINPDLFVKEEIEFELRARGKETRGNVQTLRRLLREALTAGDAPVSYTHLDVYKRQCLNCVRFFSRRYLHPYAQRDV